MHSATKTILTYALAGPPLAALATIVITAMTVATVDDGGVPEYIAATAMMGLIAVPFSYLFGGLQALFVGVGCALWQQKRGNSPVAVPLLLSFAAWVGFSVVVWATNSVSSSLASFMLSSNGALWLLNHLAAGVFCWWLTARNPRAAR